MNNRSWKRAFLTLAGVFAVFVIGLFFGLALRRPLPEQHALQPTRVQTRDDHRTPAGHARPLPEAADGSFAEVAEAALPVVVEVSVVEVVEQRSPRSLFDFFFGPRNQAPHDQGRQFERPGLGSGVIVRRNADTVYVLTNNHVVGDAREIEVGLYDGRRYQAQLVGGDPRTDLAVLQFSTAQDVPVAQLGDSDALRVGDWVLAVGNPFGFESTVTSGIVSATGRRPRQAGAGLPELTDFIQTDAAINPGNSGGALVNMAGEIVGINTWIVGSRTGGSVGLGFAIPMGQAVDAIDQFIERGRIVYGWLGVSIAEASSDSLPTLAQDLGVVDDNGALIVNVYRDSPAARDGIRPGDFVTRIGGSSIENAVDLQRAVGRLAPGEQTEFRVIRDGQQRTLTVTVEERAAEEVIARDTNLWPGMTVVPLDDDIRERADMAAAVSGAVVVAVQRQSPAGAAGLRPGDVVTHANGTDIGGARDFYRAAAEASDTLELRVARNGAGLTVEIEALQ
ncbi:MAG: Do family serine endopeptidase [Spirochaetaceae bacterium]|nr:MAG: Do family serine endopeptidase [Spirochaetaceae bacterium]